MNSHPLLYQINTRCWLHDLSARLKKPVTLASVPDTEFQFWQKSGFTHIWLMGVWTTGAQARQIAIQHPDLRGEYDKVLPGWTEADVAGSPYSITDYSVPKTLGGDAELKQFRTKLNKLGLKLVLDFVPNHMGLDHAWVTEQPELFVLSPNAVAGTFEVKTKTGSRWVANGKDPYFAPWTDVAQLEYRRASTRAALVKLLQGIATQCDGVRCDMAMLMLNDVFAKTWAHLPINEASPTEEFWPVAIQAVKTTQPGFIFMAEVYWGLEGKLQSLGFDFTYDKALYDDLVERHAAEAQRKLLTHPADYVTRSVHFLENHDEPRVAEKLSPAENRAAALAILSLPGMRFLHEGQLTGAKIKVPVQLGRRPVEPVQPEIQATYNALLAVLKKSHLGQGTGQILPPRCAWDGNGSHQNIITVLWPGKDAFDVAVVNLAAHRSQCYVSLNIPTLADRHWTMRDLLGSESYERVGSDLAQQGLYLDVPAHGAQVFRFEPVR
jgi:hypothetical protein